MAPFKILSGKFKGTFTQFTPTPPSQRLVKTFSEVQAFKRQLLLAEKGLVDHAKATADLVKLVDETITAFPRVWSRSDDGISAQLHEEDHLKPEPGNNKIVSYPSTSFRQSLEADLKEEVYIPIEKWHTRYREVKGRIGEVETARLEYDKARQKLAEAHKHALKIAAKSDAKLSTGEGDVGIRQAEAALAATREEYVRIEEAVHVELAVLVMDAQNALDYVTRALTLSSRALLDIATHHQQETVKSLPVLVTESSGPLLLGPASPMANYSPTPLALGAPPPRLMPSPGSPGSAPGTPLATNSPSPLGPGGVSASSTTTVTPIPPTTPEQPSFEAAAQQGGGYQVVTETVIGKPAGAMAPPTPAKDVPVTPEYGSTTAGQMGPTPTAPPAEPEVDTPFGPATVTSESGFDNKREEFLQQYA